jgi:hypothetical protein
MPDSSISVLQDVHFLFHLFPLPYHTYSFVVAQSAGIVRHYTNASSTLTYFNTAFDKQSDALGPAVAAKTFEVWQAAEPLVALS